MRRILAALVLTGALVNRAASAPAPAPTTPPAPAPATPAPTPTPTPAPTAAAAPAPTPTLAAAPTPDLAPDHVALTLPDVPPPRRVHPVASAAILGGVYLTFSAWAYLAWYVKHKPLGYYKWGGDGWLEDTTYAGGADKFGHAWATMSLARAGTWLLSEYGGYDHFKSSLISAALSETLFFFVEVKDGFFYEFSPSDLAGDTTGMVLALLFDNIPRLDEMFDYRVEYWPSPEYLDNVSGGNKFSRLNIAEDYSGETYLLAYHLGSIHALRDQKWGTLSRFVDLTLGFDTRGYKPTPPKGYPDFEHHQNVFIGISFNAQGFFDWVFERHHPRVRTATHALFEVFNLPFTSAPILQWSHSPTGVVQMDGA